MCELEKRGCKEKTEILVFGGTIEGRQVSDYLISRKIPHTVCVATEYGEEVLPRQAYLTVHKGRMNMEEMCRFFREGSFLAVVDATHPYAVEVSKNIRAACEREQIKYLRYLRAGAGNDGTARRCGEDGFIGEKVRKEASADIGKSSSAGASQGRDIREEDFTDTGKGQSVQDETETGKDTDSKHVWVGSAREAAEYLEKQDGVIFLTTGSKELSVFTGNISDKGRLFVRVLPSAEVIASCRALGLEGKQICGMQGPFSQAMNEAMLLQTKASWLVTKNTGVSGGFSEKIQAAEKCGVRCVIIRRPEETGYDWEELVKILDEMTGDKRKEEEKAVPSRQISCKEEKTVPSRRVSCIGIGMGTLDTLTHEAARELLEAEVIFGAKRILESAQKMWSMLRPAGDKEKDVRQTQKDCELSASENDVKDGRGVPQDRTGKGDGSVLKISGEGPVWVQEYEGEKIAAYLAEHPRFRRAAVLMSGDVGFYSGARGIAAAFPAEEVRYFCGISSVVYFASKVPTTWQDAKLLSAHGKRINLKNCVCRYPKIILLVSGAKDVEQFCAELVESGLDQVRVTVGTNLSYPEEKVTAGPPVDFLCCGTTGLHIMMIENPDAISIVSPGVPDEAFVRGKVPMTKEEVRILSVAKLRLSQDAVVYDVGAGTGSVAVECARLCTAGTVYAIEKNPDGIALIRENSRKLQVSNVVPVEGSAPQAMEELPAPTHAFIGGSSGNMKEILETLRKKNPKVRIVINTIALESISEVMKLLPEIGEENADIVQACIAKSRVLGRYHMMGALNPVYIISFGGTEQ